MSILPQLQVEEILWKWKEGSGNGEFPQFGGDSPILFSFTLFSESIIKKKAKSKETQPKKGMICMF